MDPRRVEELVGEFIERRERGEALDAETFAAQYPEEHAAILAALRTLEATEPLFPAAPDLPTRVGAYRVRGEIGRGGMGRVLAAEHPERPGQAIALKLLHASLEHQPRALERFRREGAALERLDHPGIVRVLEAGLLEQRPFLAMERVEGTSLAELLRRARERNGSALELPGEGSATRRGVCLVARLARALAAAHRAGVLHRDVNPRNVLVRADGTPVLIDFGLMRSSGDPTLTGSGDLLGTPQYMAPEQARGERVDERTDVFGLGVVLQEVLTLAPPREAGDTLALLRAAGGRPLPRPGTWRAAVPRELAPVLRRATSFFARWRTPSCEALADDLERWLRGEPVHARAPGPHVALLELAHTRRRLVAVASVLVLGAAVVALALRGPSAEDLKRQRVENTTEVVRAWFEDDLPAARAALERYAASERQAPFVDFLERLLSGDLALESRDPATRALLEGERLRRDGRGREARPRFDTAWDVAPGFPFVVLLQGLASLEGGDLPAARERFEFSAYSFGSSPRLHRTLGAIYAGLGLWTDSTRALSAALALEPASAEALVALVRAQERAGQGDAALETAARALTLAAPPRSELLALAEDWEQGGSAELGARLRARVEGRE